jgi:MFS family permease
LEVQCYAGSRVPANAARLAAGIFHIGAANASVHALPTANASRSALHSRAAGDGPRPETARIVLLVTVAVFINYIDRGNLATTATRIQDDLHLNATQLGLLLSAFYWSYVPFMLATGWLADRFGAKVVLGSGLAVWAIATMSTGFATGFAGLLALRLLLGVGESVTFPSVSKILADAVEVGRLGVANGVMSFGYLVGPAVGTLIAGYLMILAGWRAVFIVTGALSLLWLLPWRRVVIDPPVQRGTVDEPPPTFPEILGQRALWGAALGHFASNYIYYFILNWLPFYLIRTRGFSEGSMTTVLSLAYAVNAASAFAMGWLTDRWIRAGRSATLIYKSIMGITHIVGIACMVGMMMLPESGCIISLFAFCLVAGCSYPGIFAIPQIIAGPKAAGRWVGVQNGTGNTAGPIATMITGVLVDRTGLFDVAFGIAAAVNVLGFIGWVVLLQRVEPIDWGAVSRRVRRAPGDRS